MYCGIEYIICKALNMNVVITRAILIMTENWMARCSLSGNGLRLHFDDKSYLWPVVTCIFLNSHFMNWLMLTDNTSHYIFGPWFGARGLHHWQTLPPCYWIVWQLIKVSLSKIPHKIYFLSWLRQSLILTNLIHGSNK